MYSVAKKSPAFAKSHIYLYLTGILCLLLPGLQWAADFNDGNYTHIEYPGWFHDTPFVELDDILKQAKTNGKQGLMVLYTTEGCSYCGVFIKKNLADPDIAKTVQKHFISIGLEIFNDVELVRPDGTSTSVKAFAKQEGVQFSPTVLFYGPDGEQLFRFTGYQTPERFKTTLQYVTGKHYRQQTLAEYVQRTSVESTSNQTAYALKTDPLFGKPPHLLQRNVYAAQQPLLVIFEKPGCNACADLHDIVLSQDKVRQALKKFEVVRLNALDDKSMLVTPEGKRLTPAAWFKQAQFSHSPALMFYTEKGQAALTTDALVKTQRMMNSIHYMLERAHEKGWTYQRFARSKAIERNAKKNLARTVK